MPSTEYRTRRTWIILSSSHIATPRKPMLAAAGARLEAMIDTYMAARNPQTDASIRHLTCHLDGQDIRCDAEYGPPPRKPPDGPLLDRWVGARREEREGTFPLVDIPEIEELGRRANGKGWQWNRITISKRKDTADRPGGRATT